AKPLEVSILLFNVDDFFFIILFSFLVLMQRFICHKKAEPLKPSLCKAFAGVRGAFATHNNKHCATEYDKRNAQLRADQHS
ncbi:hypothetical protein, partial [Ruminococcus sp.]|uniref:hypothetical protein n=1 Tax=Ruminococcus sp. TaxID=41978 RepID=UPI003AF07138